MSGLEKFQNDPAWRQKLLNHLLTDRPQTAAALVVEEEKERRHSLQIVLDFPALIRAKKAELLEKQKREEDEKEKKTEEEIMFTYREFKQSEDADESFDVFERMCDKTASDPDSTLFQYLHSDDKDQVLAMAKERSTRADKSNDMEVSALRRMLEEVNCHDMMESESPLKGVECTQLEDIEAPSRFWDNDSTLSGNDSIFVPSAKTSPVKMVGLLRPSTILEANEADLTGILSDESSLKTARSSETIASGSSCYETAADNSLSSSKDAATLNVDDLFYAAIAKAKPPGGMSRCEQEELLKDLQESLIDLAARENQSIISDMVDDTVIELSSSGEEEDGERKDLKTEIKEEESFTTEEQEDFLAEESLLENNKENKSLHFNDTMEEMEYLMQKGQEYLAAQATPKPTPTTPLSASKTNLNLPKQNTFVLTPKKLPLSPAIRKPPTSASSSSRYEIDMDHPTSNSKFFKHPSSIPMRRQLKLPKDQFAHIISPIRAYTHKSGTAPLMSKFRQTHNVDIDALNALSNKELEEESRICQLKRVQAVSAGNLKPLQLGPNIINSTARLLPKKAYISSELKQVVDERTPMPMPNVPRIQKYLNSAVEPTVLRHEGKLKMPNQSGKNTSHIPRRPNQSFADLSLASGDISLYTIKDAQKF